MISVSWVHFIESPLRHHLKKWHYAEVVELVDTLDLGSSAARRGSSSLLFGTMNKDGRFESFATHIETPVFCFR